MASKPVPIQKNMKTSAYILIVLLCSFSLSSLANERIRISTGEWPPFLSEQLEHNGVGLRVIREAFALENIDVEYQFHPWKRAYRLVQQGVTEASATWAKNAEREQKLYYSEPLYQSPFVFFHRKSTLSEWSSLADLKGLHVGFTDGYTYTPELHQAATDKLFIRHTGISDVQNLRMLLNHRIDLFPINIDVGYHLLASEFNLQERKLLTHNPLLLTSHPTYLVFSKKSANARSLLQKFNRGLKRLAASGKIEQYFQESRQGAYKNVKK